MLPFVKLFSKKSMDPVHAGPRTRTLVLTSSPGQKSIELEKFLPNPQMKATAPDLDGPVLRKRVKLFLLFSI